MTELETKIRDVLAVPQLASLASITLEGLPWARYVMVAADDDLVLRCASFTKARKVEQIAANPEVHLTCGVTNPAEMKPYLQIQARARFTTDEVERHAFWSDMLAAIFEGPDDPDYGVVIMEPTLIEYWMPGTMDVEVWKPER